MKCFLKCFLSLQVLLLIVNCGSKSNTNSSDLNVVFGSKTGDDRKLLSDYGSEFNVVARSVGQMGGCTATLVGESLVLTAAHCVWDSEKQLVKPEVIYFMPNSSDGNFRDKEYIDRIWLFSKNPEKDRAKDLAILKLKRPIGQLYAFMGLKIVDFDSHLQKSPNLTVSLIGYSADKYQGKSPTVHRNCYIHKKMQEKLLHDCDATTGASGGPVLEILTSGDITYQRIIALMVSEYKNGVNPYPYVEKFEIVEGEEAEKRLRANIAVSIEPVFNIVDKLRKTVDDGKLAPEFPDLFEMANPNSPTSAR